jgi:hypothetical protein
MVWRTECQAGQTILHQLDHPLDLALGKTTNLKGLVGYSFPSCERRV